MTMRNKTKTVFGIGVSVVLMCAPAWAHHGSGISYDTAHLWTTWATVTQFNYLNPHCSMTFDRVDKNGKVEHWTSELLDNPTMLLRAGWPRGRSNEALKPGTRVKLYIGTSRAGGFDGIVLKLENEKGENIVGNRGETQAVDMDGVPGGLQPSADVKQ